MALWNEYLGFTKFPPFEIFLVVKSKISVICSLMTCSLIYPSGHNDFITSQLGTSRPTPPDYLHVWPQAFLSPALTTCLRRILSHPSHGRQLKSCQMWHQNMGPLASQLEVTDLFAKYSFQQAGPHLFWLGHGPPSVLLWSWPFPQGWWL